jgi:hypothetical protein
MFIENPFSLPDGGSLVWRKTTCDRDRKRKEKERNLKFENRKSSKKRHGNRKMCGGWKVANDCVWTVWTVASYIDVKT